MKKIVLTSIILLVLFTSLVKNSTKEIEDKTYVVNENIRSLNTVLADTMLEYNYLSSPEKLKAHQDQYFQNELIKTDVVKIKKIFIENDILKISNFIN